MAVADPPGGIKMNAALNLGIPHPSDLDPNRRRDGTSPPQATRASTSAAASISTARARIASAAPAWRRPAAVRRQPVSLGHSIRRRPPILGIGARLAGVVIAEMPISGASRHRGRAPCLHTPGMVAARGNPRFRAACRAMRDAEKLPTVAIVATGRRSVTLCRRPHPRGQALDQGTFAPRRRMQSRQIARRHRWTRPRAFTKVASGLTRIGFHMAIKYLAICARVRSRRWRGGRTAIRRRNPPIGAAHYTGA
jgi:hypothetical protein